MGNREITQLRPRSIGELLDQAIRLYRNNFLTYVGIIGVMQIPLTLLSLVVSLLMVNSLSGQFTGNYSQTNMLGTLAAGGGTIIIGIASFILISGLATAALTRAIADNYMGEETGILSAYQKIKGSWGSIIGSLFLLGLIGFAVGIWTIVPIAGWLSGPGILIFLGIIVAPLIAPSVVLEKRNASNALSRAWSLGMKRFWWIIGYMAILAGLSYVIVSAPTSLVSYFTQSRLQESLMAGDTSFYIWQTIIQSLLSLVLSLIYTPLRLTGVILAYFDLRVRFESFDLAVLAHQAETDDVQAESLTALSLENEQTEKVFTGQNIGRFVGLSVLGIALFFILGAIGLISTFSMI